MLRWVEHNGVRDAGATVEENDSAVFVGVAVEPDSAVSIGVRDVEDLNAAVRARVRADRFLERTGGEDEWLHRREERAARSELVS